MEDYIVSWVVSGVAFWSTAFLLVRALFPKRSCDFCNRAVSTMHAVASVCLACLSVEDWACPVCPLAAPSSPRQMKALAVTLSYMVYDAACCHLNGDARLDNTAHHLVSIVGIGAGLAYQRCGTEMVACLLVTEISSPLLHLREMLKEFGVKDTDLNLLVDDPVRGDLLAGKNGFGAVHHLRHCEGRQPDPHQGDGYELAAGERVLVLEDPRDGQVQAGREEEAGQSRRRQVMCILLATCRKSFGLEQAMQQECKLVGSCSRRCRNSFFLPVRVCAILASEGDHVAYCLIGIGKDRCF